MMPVFFFEMYPESWMWFKFKYGWLKIFQRFHFLNADILTNIGVSRDRIVTRLIVRYDGFNVIDEEFTGFLTSS